jgi:nucleoside-diphosphate-sugar epimerase
MKVLVTGGTGFVGRHLVRALIEKGVLVRMLVRKTSNIEEFKGLGVELVHGDITDRDSLQGIARDINVVYNLAAMGHVSAISKAAYQRFFDVNVNGTNNLAEECCNNKVDKFVHFSSTAAMGLIKKPLVDETMPCQPSTPYQKSKCESEKTILTYWKEKGLPAVILRPCMIYGAGGTGEFTKICRLIKKGLFPKVGRGKNLTPIVNVRDVVQAAILAGDKGKLGEMYLITSNKSYELDEIKKLISRYLGIDKRYPYVPYKVAIIGAYSLQIMARLFKFTPMVTSKNIESTVTDRTFSIAKAKNELGYEPKVELEEGIQETIQWYTDNKLL